MHADQINKFGRAGTDRVASYARDHPGLRIAWTVLAQERSYEARVTKAAA